MYPLTHIYVAKKLFNTQEESYLLGSVFPDCLSSKVSWQTAHCFYTEESLRRQYEENEEIRCFYYGLLTHGVDPKGLDYYGDVNYKSAEKRIRIEGANKKGYAYQKSAPLVKEVMECCGLDERGGIWKAHNFVEMAAEIMTILRHPALSKEIRDILKKQDMIKKCTGPIDQYFHFAEGYAFQSLSGLINRLVDESYHLDTIYESLIDKFSYTIRYQFGNEMDKEKGIAILQKAKTLIEEDLDLFLEDVTEKIRQNCNTFLKQEVF